jgi:hypothetical protein
MFGMSFIKEGTKKDFPLLRLIQAIHLLYTPPNNHPPEEILILNFKKATKVDCFRDFYWCR